MIATRVAFAQALKKAMPGVENGKTLLQGADTLVFKKGVVYSFNDHISVSTPLPTGLEDLAGAVKAQEFYALVSKFQGESLEIVPQDDKWVLKCGDAEAELSLLQEKVSDRIALIGPKDDWAEVPQGFRPVLTACILPANSSTLSGVYSSEAFLVSTDEMRINCLSLNSDMGTWWVSDSAAAELLKLPDLAKFQVADGWVHFLTAEGTIISLKRLVDDQYPFQKLKAVVKKHEQSPGDFAGTLPAALRDAVDRASALASGIESFSAVDMTFGDAGILVASQKSIGKYKEMVKWDTELVLPEGALDIKPFKITLDKGMIAYGLKLARSFYLKEVTLKSGTSQRLVFKTEHGVQLVSALEADAGKGK